MVTPQEAIEDYVCALRSVGADLFSYHFKFEGNRVCIGHGRTEEGIQWNMMWHTPEELVEAAKRRRMNLKTGDPRKPDVIVLDK
jgi:hypothetical protein